MTQEPQVKSIAFLCKFCEETVTIQHKRPNLAKGWHLKKCERKKRERELKKKREATRQKRAEKRQELQELSERTKAYHDERRKLLQGEPITLNVDKELELIIGNMETIERELDPRTHEDQQRFVSKALSIVRIKQKPPTMEYHIPETKIPSPEIIELVNLDEEDDDDFGDGEPKVLEPDERRLYSPQEFTQAVEQKAEKLIETILRRKSSIAPTYPKEIQEEEEAIQKNLEYMQRHLGEKKKPKEGKVLAEEIEELQAAEHIAEHGMIVKDGASITDISQKFQEAIRVFMTYNKFDAIYAMYHRLVQSFIEWSGGFGLNDSKKQAFLEEIDEIDFIFKHLKGEARGEKEFRDLRVFCDRHLSRRIFRAIWAVMFDTKSAREEAWIEYKLRLAENVQGYYGDEDIAQELRSKKMDDDFWKMEDTENE